MADFESELYFKRYSSIMLRIKLLFINVYDFINAIFIKNVIQHCPSSLLPLYSPITITDLLYIQTKIWLSQLPYITIMLVSDTIFRNKNVIAWPVVLGYSSTIRRHQQPVPLRHVREKLVFDRSLPRVIPHLFKCWDNVASSAEPWRWTRRSLLWWVESRLPRSLSPDS